MNGKSAKKGLVPALFAVVTAAILVAAVVSICVGKYSITVDDIRAIFAGKEVDDMTRRVFLTLRLSRTIMAIISGVGLGFARRALVTKPAETATLRPRCRGIPWLFHRHRFDDFGYAMVESRKAADGRGLVVVNAAAPCFGCMDVYA